MESRKFTEEMGNKRQALRDIKNFVGAPPPYPRAINKRRLPDKSALDDNNQQFAGHCPMTRKFAASLAEKQLSHPDISRRSDKIKNEKIERAIPSIPSSNNLENITVINVEEYMDPASVGVFLMEDISKLWGAPLSVKDWINSNKQL